MTVPELIEGLLDRLRATRYHGRAREFERDRRPLMKAVARYGHECRKRGWQFDEAAIFRDLCERVIDRLPPAGMIRTWLPVYLESAVDRHVRLRAEELAADSRAAASTIRRVLRDAAPRAGAECVREATAVETLDCLYRDLKRVQRARRAVQRAAAAVRMQQGVLC